MTKVLAGRNACLQSLETSVSWPPVPSTGEGRQTALHLLQCTALVYPCPRRLTWGLGRSAFSDSHNPDFQKTSSAGVLQLEPGAPSALRDQLKPAPQMLAGFLKSSPTLRALSYIIPSQDTSHAGVKALLQQSDRCTWGPLPRVTINDHFILSLWVSSVWGNCVVGKTENNGQLACCTRTQ